MSILEINSISLSIHVLQLCVFSCQEVFATCRIQVLTNVLTAFLSLWMYQCGLNCEKGNEIIIHNSMDNNAMVNVVLCFKIVFVFCKPKKNHQIHSYHSQTKISKLSLYYYLIFSLCFQYIFSTLDSCILSIIEFASFNQDFPFINNANKLYMFLSFVFILYKVLLSFINLSLELTIFCWSA